jgi:deferrochelatase/peroxidase EfeB
VGNPGRLGRTRSLPTGELLHGYPDLDSRQPAAPDAPFRRNGTFMVWRKLEQDVVAFRRWLVDQARATGIDAEEVAAKAMGRWRDGTPAVRSPDRPLPALAADEAFRFKEDARGLACPLGAHIRRANPRDSLGFGAALTGRHRMVRRGMPYGSHLPPDSPDDGQSRGLLFVALVADIERQYEFVQVQWLNGGNLFGLGDDRDPIAGQGDGTGKMTVPGHPPRFLHPLPALVTMRGGEYLYVPSINGLRHLAGGAL